MPVKWKGRVAIPDLSRQSRGDFQLHELVDLIPHIPRQGLRPCNPFLAFADQTSSPVVDLVGAILRPYGAGTPKSEHLQEFEYASTNSRRVLCLRVFISSPRDKVLNSYRLVRTLGRTI